MALRASPRPEAGCHFLSQLCYRMEARKLTEQIGAATGEEKTETRLNVTADTSDLTTGSLTWSKRPVQLTPDPLQSSFLPSVTLPWGKSDRDARNQTGMNE
ncbi:uncharacterized [Tachysurus ichikawai]